MGLLMLGNGDDFGMPKYTYKKAMLSIKAKFMRGYLPHNYIVIGSVFFQLFQYTNSSVLSKYQMYKSEMFWPFVTQIRLTLAYLA